MAVTDRMSSGIKNVWTAWGNIGKENLRKPYAPILSRIPARSTLPAVGASVWASGSQVWMGNMGIFTANAAKKARNSQNCNPAG